MRSALVPLVVVALLAAACSKQPDKSGATAAGAPPAAHAPAGDPTMAPSHAPDPTKAQAEPDAASAKAMSVADVWANRKTLAGKTVTVTGKVVKYNGGILGRNWIHIQDGTGSAEDRTNDLAITTADETKAGDTITVTGVVGVDRDFTAGYQYPVMLENARIASTGQPGNK